MEMRTLHEHPTAGLPKLMRKTQNMSLEKYDVKRATHEIQPTREYDIKLDLQKGAVMTPAFIWTG
jgi:hypothetical protein